MNKNAVEQGLAFQKARVIQAKETLEASVGTMVSGKSAVREIDTSSV